MSIEGRHHLIKLQLDFMIERLDNRAGSIETSNLSRIAFVEPLQAYPKLLRFKHSESNTSTYQRFPRILR